MRGAGAARRGVASVWLPIVTLILVLLAAASAQAEDPPAPAAPAATPEPAGPTASPEVQEHLDEAERLLGAKDAEGALAAAERALSTSREGSDPAGEAFAVRARARSFEALGRSDEALAAWREVERRWEAQGALPERIEAIGAQALLSVRGKDPDGLERAVERAVELSAQTTDRPAALVAALVDAAERSTGLGQLVPAERLSRAALAIAEPRLPGSLAHAASLEQLGSVAWRKKEYSTARELHTRALGIREERIPGSLEVAESWNHLGKVAWSEGNLASARELYGRALAIRERLAPGSLEVAAGHFNLAMIDRKVGDLDAAQRGFDLALGIHEAHGPRSALVASTLLQLAGVARSRGDLASAKGLLERALSIQEETAPGSMEVSSTLGQLASVSYWLGDLDAARARLVGSLEILQVRAPGSLGEATVIHNLGIMDWEQGDFEDAGVRFRRAIEIRGELAPGSLDLAFSLNSMGNVLWRGGDLDGARRLYLQAEAIREELAPRSLDLAATLDCLGVVAHYEGNLDSAYEYHRRAQEIRQEVAPDDPANAIGIGNLGNVAMARGDLDAARDCFERVRAIEQAHSPRSLNMASTLNNLGSIARLQGDLAAAREYHRLAMEIVEERAPGSLDLAATLMNRGNIALSERDYEGAARFYRGAMEIHEARAPDSIDLSGSMDNLGMALRGLGDLEGARALHLGALRIREAHGPGSLDVVVSRKNLGLVELEEGRIEAARDCFAQAWSIAREQGSAVAGDEARLAFTETHAEYASHLIEAEIRLGRTDHALGTIEESRAQGLLELFGRRGLSSAASAEAWSAYRRAEGERDRAGEVLAGASTRIALFERQEAAAGARGAEGDGPAPRTIELARAREEREAALSAYTRARVEAAERLAEVKRAVPTLSPEAVSVEAARGALPAGAVFVAFSVGAERTAVLLVPADPERALMGYVVELGGPRLVERVEAIRAELARGGAERGIGFADAKPVEDGSLRLREASRALHETLFPAEARALIDGAERIVISPDGPLWALPFAALDVGRGDEPRWWGLEKPISYAPSLTTLVEARRRGGAPPGERTVLVIGDPALRIADGAEEGEGDDTAVADAAAAEKLSTGGLAAAPTERTLLFPGDEPPPPLPGAREEAERLGALYGVEPLLGDHANEAAVRLRLPGARIVHFATHGTFHPTQPMSSGVLLAPSPGAQVHAGDGALQAWEFLSAVELDADLVVLSACETGLGRSVRGEGLVGLTRSLQAAGARSVVATHWKVEDRSAADLMVAFHEKLRAGLAKDEALRAAMREVAAVPATSHPYFWAAYFLSGEAR